MPGSKPFYPLSEKWKLSSYFRIEERFQNSQAKQDSIRLRLRFRTDYKLNPPSMDHSWHKLTLGIEGFKSYSKSEINTETKDQYNYESHVSVAIERTLIEQKKVRFELMWKYKSPPKYISESSVNTVYFKIQYYPVWGEVLTNRLFHRGIDD